MNGVEQMQGERWRRVRSGKEAGMGVRVREARRFCVRLQLLSVGDEASIPAQSSGREGPGTSMNMKASQDCAAVCV